MTGNILPKYDSDKGPSAYRSELKRTLLKGKFLKFQNQNSLDKTANIILKAKHARLRFILAELRYNLLVTESSSKQISLSKNGEHLIIQQGNMSDRIIAQINKS